MKAALQNCKPTKNSPSMRQKFSIDCNKVALPASKQMRTSQQFNWMLVEKTSILKTSEMACESFRGKRKQAKLYPSVELVRQSSTMLFARSNLQLQNVWSSWSFAHTRNSCVLQLICCGVCQRVVCIRLKTGTITDSTELGIVETASRLLCSDRALPSSETSSLRIIAA